MATRLLIVSKDLAASIQQIALVNVFGHRLLSSLARVQLL